MNQEQRILQYFEAHPDDWYTAEEVFAAVFQPLDESTLDTIRRTLSALKNNEEIVRTAKREKCHDGTPRHKWKFNRMKNFNPWL